MKVRKSEFWKLRIILLLYTGTVTAVQCINSNQIKPHLASTNLQSFSLLPFKNKHPFFARAKQTNMLVTSTNKKKKGKEKQSISVSSASERCYKVGISKSKYQPRPIHEPVIKCCLGAILSWTDRSTDLILVEIKVLAAEDYNDTENWTSSKWLRMFVRQDPYYELRHSIKPSLL